MRPMLGMKTWILLHHLCSKVVVFGLVNKLAIEIYFTVYFLINVVNGQKKYSLSVGFHYMDAIINNNSIYLL